MPGLGSCACGTVSFQYSGEPTLTALCHCKGCQNWGGSAFSSNVGVPTTNFSLTKGEPKSWVRNGDVSGKENRHFFCGGCGSSLFSRPEALGEITLIKSGCLEETNILIALELFATRRRDYIVPVADAKQAPEMP
ncbi:hypothetical protein PMG11_05373 [Penicillium brasilianum]|uniref:CENP-V/GFA domain-containing protein n=1 Tax=Penicillium brasilianum TaxID=104259 RepID=A0A0F7VI33_PENBI|nr:hypothetical protein PMG11_05373 [Penicillium brasilianum]